jgi:hypothetical protein
LSFNGQTMTMGEWESKTGIHRKTISDRIDRGWTARRALCTLPSKK